MAVNILCVGDVVGPAGRGVLADRLEGLITERGIDLVVCNAENAAGGSGLTPQMFEKLLHYGVDVVTMGDHVYRKQELIPVLRDSKRIVRPANLLPGAVGRRWTVAETKSGGNRVAVTCLLGQMFMKQNDSPFTAVDAILGEMPSDVVMRVIDFHAEASSEKIAMGWHVDGRASVVFGTHTHIPTADARVLPRGTAYISDVGMTGPYDGVLGRRKDRVLQYMTTSMPARFDVAKGDPRLCGVLATVSAETGRARAIERIEIRGRTDEG
ncbi:MAG: YmdB family metallophosphoesterase [Phycisphaerae bacterium]|nr:YmdB family metallophosphoesterase [Phycisphaerae bacterium]